MREIDDYGTCLKTFATLRIYPPSEVGVDGVSTLLGLVPSSTESRPGSPGWFLSTQGQVPSNDVRRHIDWISERLLPCAQGLHSLREMGSRVDIFCYWLSRSGHGGPTLSPRQTSALSQLQLDCGFDVYFLGESAG